MLAGRWFRWQTTSRKITLCSQATFRSRLSLQARTLHCCANSKKDVWSGETAGPSSNQWLNRRSINVKRSFTTSKLLLQDFQIVHTPPFAESVTEGDVRWEKGIGDSVAEDEVVGEIETDKTAIPVTSPAAGVIEELFVEDGGRVEKGDKLFKLKLGPGGTAASAPAPAPAPPPPPKAEQAPSPPPPPPSPSPPSAKPTTTEASPREIPKEAPAAVVQPPGPIRVVTPTPPPPPPKSQAVSEGLPKESKEAPTKISGTRSETKVKMSRMRLRIAQRLKDAQNTNAMLTTFNEIDMSNIMEMRKIHKDAFQKKHNMKIGFMSAFVKASAYALQSMPVVNAVIEDGYTVYRDYVDISVAVATPKGLVVPVLRNVHDMNYLDIEKGINALGEKARTGELAIEDMDGGTFTISNGGVFGSLMGTPIINPPQSAILGMHAIVDRPVAVNGKVEIRPMMYVALTYDHRLIDGREAVTFLRKIKGAVEDPRVMLMDL